MYEVNVVAGFPDPLDSLKISCEGLLLLLINFVTFEERTSIDKSISVSTINPQLSQAINILQRLDNEMDSSPQAKAKQRKNKLSPVIETQLQQNSTMFKVECGPYFSAPPEYVFKADKVKPFLKKVN
jgi:hypothetical protein